MRILIVEDVTAMRKAIHRILEAEGYDDVVEASGGVEAIGMLGGVELILTDLNMPGMNGISFIKAVRDSKEYATVPIMVVTAVNSREQLARTSNLGVKDYILKPFDVDHLLERVKVQEEEIDRKKQEVNAAIAEQLKQSDSDS
jgi:DNA-binding response OmpR family regulator